MNNLLRFAGAAVLAATALATARAQAPAVQTLTLTVTGKGSTNEWPVYIAEAKGLFESAGLKIELISTQSTASQIQQIAASIKANPVEFRLRHLSEERVSDAVKAARVRAALPPTQRESTTSVGMRVSGVLS